MGDKERVLGRKRRKKKKKERTKRGKRRVELKKSERGLMGFFSFWGGEE